MKDEDFAKLKYTEVKYNFWKVTKKSELVPLIMAIFLFLAVVIYNICNAIDIGNWENIFNVVIVMVIPIVPIAYLWKSVKQKDWEASLEAFLNLKIKNQEDDSVVAFFEAIPVQNGANIRQQAQTLCKELVGGYVDNLELFIRSEGLEESTEFCNALNDNVFKAYNVCLYVKTVGRKPENKSEKIINIEKNKYWYWCPLVNYKNSVALPYPKITKK